MKKAIVSKSGCQETVLGGSAFVNGDGVRIRLMVERTAKAGVLAREVFFDGGDVIRCYRGRFRFTAVGRQPIEIGPGEVIVVYPEQSVTIEALEKSNQLVYVIFEGHDVSAYFDSLGFFNGIHGPTSDQIALFREVKNRFEANEEADAKCLMQRLSDALVTYAHDLRVGANIIVADAIRKIHANLKKGVVRLAPLYVQLGIGHTTLNEAFRHAGLESPSAYIRHEQLNLVLHLLKETRKPIGEVAAEAGFISPTHFANFVKRLTGRTSREIRFG